MYSAYVNSKQTSSAEIRVLGALRQDYLKKPSLLEIYCKISVTRQGEGNPEVHATKVINITSILLGTQCTFCLNHTFLGGQIER